MAAPQRATDGCSIELSRPGSLASAQREALMNQPTFKDLEHEGWTARAHAYDGWLAPITRQAIDPIL
jgi:hypothetical protein